MDYIICYSLIIRDKIVFFIEQVCYYHINPEQI
jgi:hypothetical protein